MNGSGVRAAVRTVVACGTAAPACAAAAGVSRPAGRAPSAARLD